MKQYIKRYAKNFDYPLFFVYIALTLFGLVMIYSASMAWSMATRWASVTEVPR